MTDRYPFMSRQYAVDALKLRFGVGNVTSEQDQVTVSAQYPGRQDLTLVNLTIEQAKFVAVNSTSYKDLIEENYPEKWPGPRSPSTVPRPVQIGAVPVDVLQKLSEQVCYAAVSMIKPRPALFKWRHFEPEIIVCAVRWYLRFSLSYRDVEELLMERGLPADHTTIWRWVQRYAPELNRRCRQELKPTNGSWRVDETYICQSGSWRYLYRAVDSSGATIDFWFSAERDALAAKRFFQKALQAPGHPRPRVITVDGNPPYPKVIAKLKQEGKLGRRCRCRTCPYLNNVVEQDHRAIKRRVNASQGFRSFDGAWRTIQGYEVLHMIRKGQVRWLAKGDVLGQIQFIREILGLKAE